MKPVTETLAALVLFHFAWSNVPTLGWSLVACVVASFLLADVVSDAVEYRRVHLPPNKGRG